MQGLGEGRASGASDALSPPDRYKADDANKVAVFGVRLTPARYHQCLDTD